tara:strand:- start:624 stop:905 length:282 start_codon:yes stop_codon:yes gene_type:complete
MQKFLSIPVTSEQKQLVSCNDIKLIEQGSTTTVTIAYGGGKVVTITHAVDASGSEDMRDAIQDGVVQVLKQQWTEVILEMGSLPKAVSAIVIV